MHDTLPELPCGSLRVAGAVLFCTVHDENLDGAVSKQELFRFFLASLRVSVNENIEQSTRRTLGVALVIRLTTHNVVLMPGCCRVFVPAPCVQ